MINFSIITCTRNSMAYLPATIRSVQMQTCSDYEHIFVDGNSTDGTLEYIKELPGNVRLIENVAGGIARAMNEGIRAASGEVIAHMHSDDYYYSPDVFASVANALEQSGAQWVFGRIMSDIDNVVSPESYVVPRYSYKRFLQGNFIPHPATFIRRSVFEDLGVFSETLRYAMDYDLFLRIAKRYTPLQLDQHLAVFRRHDGSTTQANFMKSFEEDFRVRCHHAHWYELPDALARYVVRRHRHLRRLKGDGQ